MAIDLMTENISSPKIPFSNDHHKKADEKISEDDQFTTDFDFCISITESETSSADELFSDGLILPLQLQEKFVLHKSLSIPKPQSQPPLQLLPLPQESPKQEPSKEIITSTNDEELDAKKQSNPFWRISRSSSVHSHKKSSFWSLPILPRSNSTGSIPKGSKEGQKQSPNVKKSKKLTGSLSQKPPLRKNYGGSHPNGVRISPILNVPPYNIKGTPNLFGFGSLFGKDNKSKK
ncbi:hypothetical protein Leryth_006116 [Lithospermum erythrorhizon]|nr:hypothetical protein Leryth_006116 [Lithospermum erythrorhizon]